MIIEEKGEKEKQELAANFIKQFGWNLSNLLFFTDYKQGTNSILFLMVCNKIMGKFEIYQTLYVTWIRRNYCVLIRQDSSSPLL